MFFRGWKIWAGLFLFGWLLLSPFPSRAQEGIKGDDADRIQVRADRLVADDAEQYAEFIGNVEASQGKTVITAQRLKILYQRAEDGGAGKTGGQEPDQNNIRRIVASGEVKIRFDDMNASAREAVYTPEDRVLILKGPHAKIIQKDSGSISGEKIIINRNDGRITFEGGVEGFLFPGEKGLK